MNLVRVLYVLSCACVLQVAVASGPLGNEGQWQVWKLVHGKSYFGGIYEEQQRKAIWQDNLKVCLQERLQEDMFCKQIGQVKNEDQNEDWSVPED